MRTIEYAMERVKEIAADWKTPDDDIEPVILTKAASGNPDNPHDAVLMLGGMMQSAEAKAYGAEHVIPSLLASTDAIEATMVTTAYVITVPKDTDPGDVTPPSQDPDRLEVVFVFGVDEDMEAETWMAYIGRDPLGADPPTLSDFEQVSGGDVEASYDGQFTKAITKGLKAAKRLRDALNEDDD